MAICGSVASIKTGRGQTDPDDTSSVWTRAIGICTTQIYR